MKREDLDLLNSDDTIDIPDFVEDKTATESSVDMSIFKMSDDELYDDNDDEVNDDDDFVREKKSKSANPSSLLICLILIVVLLATTIGCLIYGIKQHSAYVKVNTENVQLKANEDAYKRQIAEKDATIEELTKQINNSSSSSSNSGNTDGNIIYEVTDGPLHFRVAPTSDADYTTYNGNDLANNGEKFRVIEVVKDRDLGDQLKWAKIADNIYFLIEDNGNVYAKKS